MSSSPAGSDPAIKAFYETADRESEYAAYPTPEVHPFYPVLSDFIARHGLADKAVLEVGCGKGLFQDVAEGYVGVDVAESLRDYFHRPYHVVNGPLLPFPDNTFDAGFSYATHEHIPELEKSLAELLRVLKPGAPCLLAPAFHTRPWFAAGLTVRPYADLTLRQKIAKATIPIRDAKIIRYPHVIGRRLLHYGLWVLKGRGAQRLRYGKLRPNYETYWQSDSDACNSIDPFDVILWLRGQGIQVDGQSSLLKALLFRAEALQFAKPRIK